MSDRRDAVRWITSDLSLVTRIGIAALTSWIVPERLWDPVTGMIGEAMVRWNAGMPSRQSREIAEVLYPASAQELRAVHVERIASGHASRLYGLREYRRGAHRLRIRLTGDEHVLQALQRGRGAILWIGRFAFASFVSKVALHERGFRVSHLSRPSHGFGTSPFAVRRLNPIWTRVEEKYLQERMVMVPGRETSVLRTLRRRLAKNEIVSIAVGSEGIQTVSVPLLAGQLRLASGPVSLSLASGAPLLPVFTVRDRERGFEVTVDAPLELPAHMARKEHVEFVARQYAQRLAPFVRDYPGQWLGSSGTTPPERYDPRAT